MVNSTALPFLNSTQKHLVSTEGGIFSGKGVLNSPLALFLVQATLIIFLARFIHYFLNKLKQPRVISEIIGGICLGPSILGNIPGFTETLFPKQSLPLLSLVASFGLILYMFLMGLELDTSILIKGARRFVLISIAGIILPGLLGAAVSYGLYEFLLEQEKRDATPFSSFLLFTFVALAITAFPVLARILTEKKLLATKVGLMTISAAAIDDICAWTLLALVISIINAGDRFVSIYVLATVAIYALFLLFPARIFLRKVFEKFLGHKNHMLTQMTMAVIMIMIFLSAWITEWIGVHAIFGAFLIGTIIPRMGGITVELTHKLEDLVGVALLPLYFAASGLKTKLNLLNDWTTGLFLILVVAVACIGKIVGCSMAARLTGFPWRESISIGILMNCKGLVELIVLNIGLDSGVINDRIFVVMVLMALITTFMTAPLIAYAYPRKYQQEAHTTSTIRKKSKPLTLLTPQVDDKILVFVKDVDSTPLVANILQMFKNSLPAGRALYLNGLKAFSDFERSSNIMVVTQPQNVIENDPALKMFKFFGNIIGARTKAFVAQTRISEIGTEVDHVAAKEQCDMVIVPWQQDTAGNDQQEATLSILDSLHITVALFVDRRAPGSSNFQFHDISGFVGILVPFIGGPSDRAALQLAFRFKNESNVRIVVLHLSYPITTTNKSDNDLVQAAKELARDGDITFQTGKIHDDIKPILETLKNTQIDLIIMGHAKKLDKAITPVNGEEKNTSFMRRFSQRSLNPRVSIEESIFGTLGAQIYQTPKMPSLLVVHERSHHPTNAA